MTNLSDAEIIKVMKDCGCTPDCKWCPYNDPKNEYSERCYERRNKDFDNLINRLKADVEERTDQFDRMSKVAHKLHSELVNLKVGIEKLKENAHTIDDDYLPNGELTYIEVEDIDNLLKEIE